MLLLLTNTIECFEQHANSVKSNVSKGKKKKNEKLDKIYGILEKLFGGPVNVREIRGNCTERSKSPEGAEM